MLTARCGFVLPFFLSAFCMVLPLNPALAQDVGVVVRTVQSEQIADPLEALGTLKPNEFVTVTANVAETIEAILFESGQRVAQGAVLARLESAEEQAVLQEARYTVDEAESQLERIRAVAKRGDASQSLLDEKQREFYVARARLAAIESRLANRVIRAPFSGRVGLRNVSAGAYVAPGDVITTLVDDSLMKLDFNVPSLFLASLRPGVAIRARARALGDRYFDGVVESIDNQVDPVSRSVTVRAPLDNAAGHLQAGLLMEVVLQSNPRTALVVPESALVQQRDEHYLFVVREQGAGLAVEKTQVNIGVRLNGRVEVLAGVAAGDRIVVDGTLKLQDGVAISTLDRSPAMGD